MPKLPLTLACWDYDRTRPLVDGRVEADNIALDIRIMRPQQAFRGMLERKEFHATAPLWARALRPCALVHFRLRRWSAGHYRCTPHDYAIYTQASPQQRQTFHVARPTFRWVRPPSA